MRTAVYITENQTMPALQSANRQTFLDALITGEVLVTCEKFAWFFVRRASISAPGAARDTGRMM
jgi:hypothetical protein